ncbi:MAG TPA: PEP/pyruvate-binding domain-containing protein [Enhygromyxa sp.]|nr:PEP/pyruvate-binding domain-containing protein [Enhygromyxa sp.]
MSRGGALLYPWLALLAWLLIACPASDPQWPEHDGFDDHTLSRVDSVAHFHELAASNEVGSSALKFVITGFGDRRAQAIRFLDGRFYRYHDEWYWFRLINGAAVPGSRERPLSDQSLATVAEIVDWVRTRKGPPPYGMRFVDDRLYSDYFYELAIHRERRVLGIGTLVHLPIRSGERPRDQLWGFELEYSDPVEEPDLDRFFAALTGALPPEIAGRLHFIARSPQQQQLVRRLRKREHPHAERLTSYAELAIPGEIEVYNPGLIAGRLRKLPDDPEAAAKLLTEGDPNVIWMLPAIPDELPPAAGLLTAVPQTPLAHVNLLARNRGIPNVYVGGLLDDPQLDQLARVHAPVVLLAEQGGTLVLEPISELDYGRWRGLIRSRRPTLTQVDAGALPYTIDLDAVALEHVSLLRTTAGGKAAGFPILRAAGVEMPERPLAITIRPYVEHLAELRPAIADALRDEDFQDDGRIRYLLLEGREPFDQRFASKADQAWAERFVAAHPASKAASDPIAQLLARGGIKQAIRDRPLDPRAAEALHKALRAQFGHFAVSQGLRFRSSSTVEDVEGFSGAGLYDSNTGFLDAAAQPDKKARKHDVEWALKKTWASYWSWKAFEERRMSGIDHLAGNMAVVVHARFDDALELSNGVITLTLDRSVGDQGTTGAFASMEIDVQLGALSVTNPPPGRAGKVLPEVVRVRQQSPGAAIEIERVASSTELPEGRARVLDDPPIEALLRDCIAIAERFLEVENRLLDPARARRRVTLDLEIRELAPGWPAYATGSPAPSRMVIKQVRSLDPGVPAGAERLLGLPIPRELLLFADRIEQRKCRAGRTQFDVVEIWTDPMASPDLGHGRVPFVARLRLQSRGLVGGPVELELDHRQLSAAAHPGMHEGGAWALRLGFAGAGATFDSLEFAAGLLHLRSGQQLLVSEPAQCNTETVFASSDGFLRGLLQR